MITDLNFTLLYSSCALINLTLGMLAVAQKPRSKKNWAFFSFTFSQFLWIGSLYLTYYFIFPYQPVASSFFAKCAYGLGFLMTPTLVLFFYYFPQRNIKFSQWGKALFFIMNFFIVSLSIFTDTIHRSQVFENGDYVADDLGKFYFLYMIVGLTNMAIAGWLAFKKYRQFYGLDQKKIRLAALGCFSFLTATIIHNLILPIFGVYIFIRTSILLSLLFSIPAFYAIWQHRFFHFSTLSLKAIRGVIQAAAFFVPLLIFERGMAQLIGHVNSTAVILLSAGGAWIVFKWTEQRLPHLETRAFAHFKNSLHELAARSVYCDSYATLQQMIEQTFIARLHLKKAVLFLVRDKSTSLPMAVYEKDPFTESLEKNQTPIVVREELHFMKSPSNYLEAMMQLEATLCLPLFLEKRLIGLLVLGEKPHNELYNREEIEELLALKPQLEMAFANALLSSKLKEENDLIKQLIKTKTLRLKRKNRRIRDLLRRQSDFMAVTAHEFRTPLNIAMLQIQEAMDSEQPREEVARVGQSLQQLKSLTKRLFEVQQHDLGKVQAQMRPARIFDFLENEVAAFQSLMQEKRITLNVSTAIQTPTWIAFDEALLRQVISNLLTNAYKFTPEGGRIQMTLKLVGQKVRIDIEDSGPGVPDADKKRIFEKFQTVNVAQGMGIGMGLYLCAQIVKQHGGKIGVIDAADGGALFYVELPIYATKSAGEKSSLTK